MPSAASSTSLPARSPLVTRLSRLARLTSGELDALQAAERDQHRSLARREMITEGQRIREPRALLSGWACRQRILRDGRRQILSFLLPGDLVGVCRQNNPVAATAILAITDVVTCSLPGADDIGSGLAEAYAVSGAIDEHYLLRNITRLGRLDARERLADWIVEVRERLALAGLCSGNEVSMPLTQELLADALGLTSVHVNRTLQGMRRDGLLTSRGGVISLHDRVRLEDLVEQRPLPVLVN